MCARVARSRVAEGSAIALCFVSIRAASLVITVAFSLPRFAHDSIVISWVPTVLSVVSAVRLIKNLRSNRRIHAQDIAHDCSAHDRLKMNASARSLFKIRDMDAVLRSEAVLKKWAFGYLYLTFDHWKVT